MPLPPAVPSGVISATAVGDSSTAAAGAALPWTGVADLDEDLLPPPLVVDLALGAGDAAPVALVLVLVDLLAPPPLPSLFSMLQISYINSISSLSYPPSRFCHIKMSPALDCFGSCRFFIKKLEDFFIYKMFWRIFLFKAFFGRIGYNFYLIIIISFFSCRSESSNIS